MTDKELLDWYKKNSTNKPEDMSSKDYELNMNKAIKLQQDQALQESFNNQQASIEKAQSQSQQSASISNEKLMKYLDQYQKSNGVATGQKSSDFIQANNNYAQNRAAIVNQAESQKQNLLENYKAEKLANEADAYNNQMSIIEKYRQQEIEDAQRKEAEEDRQREIEQWKLEMEAYKQQLQQTIEDRETAAADKIKAQQEADDIANLEIANERINAMYSKLMDDNAELDVYDRQKIQKVLNEYKEKFNDPKYFDRLMEMYKAITYYVD